MTLLLSTNGNLQYDTLQQQRGSVATTVNNSLMAVRKLLEQQKRELAELREERDKVLERRKQVVRCKTMGTFCQSFARLM